MTDQIVTRFDIFERKDEENGDREVVRLFEKRKLITEIDLDDVSRYDGDFDAEDLKKWLNEKPRTSANVLDYLGEEPAGDEDEQDDEGGHQIVPEKYRVKYGAAQNCGDEIALTLTEFVTLPRAKKGEDGGLDWSKLRGVAEANHIADKLAEYEDRGLRGGMCRMNIGNILRGMERRGEEVTIGSKTWPAREVEKKTRARKSSKK